ncbi:hypothetical protein KUCAC02_026589 [Chaenocephalus aceratus]|nr:hypothetical protein KUCAC02_026589 [Chaenocephalus aceratus]
MPRLKSSRRSRHQSTRGCDTVWGISKPGSARFAPAGGTGGRHRVQKWPISSLTGRQHKLVVPAESPDKNLSSLLEQSHLRSIVDGIVKMPGGRFSFGAMCTPGACATQLRTEAANAVLPRTPDAVCVMAPSNNLTSSRTITEAGVDFGKLLATAMSRWPNVFALDFVPRLTVDPDYQDMMRQEFRRVAARMGVKYTPIAEYFPVKDLDLWSRDGVHLSDTVGMPILVGSIWNAAYLQLVPAEPTPSPVVHRRSPPARRVTPRVIVKGEVAKSPQPDPSKWTVIGQGRKRSQHDEPEQSIDALQPAGTVQQEELEESYFPLTPVWFSSAMLVEMDKISPSHLPGPDECTPPSPKRQKKAKMAPKQRAPASKRTLAMRQGEAAPMVVEVILRPPTSTGTVAVEQQVEPFPGLEPSPGVEPLASVEPSPSNEPSLGVMVDVDDNRWRTAKHTVHSVFTWQTDNLDKVVVLGDDLYTSLRDQQGISGGYKLLSVPDLPKEAIIDGQTFLFQYSDFVSGDVDVVEGDLIDDGVHTTLKCGLERMCTKYDTCFLTMNGGTCAIIGQGGHYAVVDSHARSASGMRDGEGRSVVLYFRGLEHVFEYIWTFAAFLKKSQKQFEIAGVRVTHIGPIESSNLSLGPRVTPKTTGTDLGCSSAIQSTLGCTNIQMGAKRKIRKGSSACKKVKRVMLPQLIQTLLLSKK